MPCYRFVFLISMFFHTSAIAQDIIAIEDDIPTSTIAKDKNGSFLCKEGTTAKKTSITLSDILIKNYYFAKERDACENGRQIDALIIALNNTKDIDIEVDIDTNTYKMKIDAASYNWLDIKKNKSLPYLIIYKDDKVDIVERMAIDGNGFSISLPNFDHFSLADSKIFILSNNLIGNIIKDTSEINKQFLSKLWLITDGTTLDPNTKNGLRKKIKVIKNHRDKTIFGNVADKLIVSNSFTQFIDSSKTICKSGSMPSTSCFDPKDNVIIVDKKINDITIEAHLKSGIVWSDNSSSTFDIYTIKRTTLGIKDIILPNGSNDYSMTINSSSFKDSSGICSKIPNYDSAELECNEKKITFQVENDSINCQLEIRGEQIPRDCSKAKLSLKLNNQSQEEISFNNRDVSNSIKEQECFITDKTCDFTQIQGAGFNLTPEVKSINYDDENPDDDLIPLALKKDYTYRFEFKTKDESISIKSVYVNSLKIKINKYKQSPKTAQIGINATYDRKNKHTNLEEFSYIQKEMINDVFITFTDKVDNYDVLACASVSINDSNESIVPIKISSQSDKKSLNTIVINKSLKSNDQIKLNFWWSFASECKSNQSNQKSSKNYSFTIIEGIDYHPMLDLTLSGGIGGTLRFIKNIDSQGNKTTKISPPALYQDLSIRLIFKPLYKTQSDLFSFGPQFSLSAQKPKEEEEPTLPSVFTASFGSFFKFQPQKIQIITNSNISGLFAINRGFAGEFEKNTWLIFYLSTDTNLTH